MVSAQHIYSILERELPTRSLPRLFHHLLTFVGASILITFLALVSMTLGSARSRRSRRSVYTDAEFHDYLYHAVPCLLGLFFIWAFIRGRKLAQYAELSPDLGSDADLETTRERSIGCQLAAFDALAVAFYSGVSGPFERAEFTSDDLRIAAALLSGCLNEGECRRDALISAVIAAGADTSRAHVERVIEGLKRHGYLMSGMENHTLTVPSDRANVLQEERQSIPPAVYGLGALLLCVYLGWCYWPEDSVRVLVKNVYPKVQSWGTADGYLRPPVLLIDINTRAVSDQQQTLPTSLRARGVSDARTMVFIWTRELKYPGDCQTDVVCYLWDVEKQAGVGTNGFKTHQMGDNMPPLPYNQALAWLLNLPLKK